MVLDARKITNGDQRKTREAPPASARPPTSWGRPTCALAGTEWLVTGKNAEEAILSEFVFYAHVGLCVERHRHDGEGGRETVAMPHVIFFCGVHCAQFSMPPLPKYSVTSIPSPQ